MRFLYYFYNIDINVYIVENRKIIACASKVVFLDFRSVEKVSDNKYLYREHPNSAGYIFLTLVC